MTEEGYINKNLRAFEQEWQNRLEAQPKRSKPPQTPTSEPATPQPKAEPLNNLNKHHKAQYFVGRDIAAKQLDELFSKHQQVAIVAVSGMGGVGKTELALQWATAHLNNYPGGVCWLNVQGGNVGLQLVRFAQTFLNVEPPPDWELEEQLTYCWQYWPEGNVLLIFDDVTDYRHQVQPYIPPDNQRFHSLLTTRLQFSRTLPQLSLDILKPLAAWELLKFYVTEERLRQNPWAARRLCRELGYLPLALELVGRYLNLHQTSWEDILKRLARKRLEHPAMKDADPLMRYRRGVYEAFLLSWEELDDNTQQLGCWLGLFALAPISLSLEDMEDDEEKEKFETGLSCLCQCHLIQLINPHTYQLHPLIRQFLQMQLDQRPDKTDIKRSFIQTLIAFAQTIEYTLTRQQVAELLPNIPHLQEVAELLMTHFNKNELGDLIPDNELGDLIADEDLIWPFIRLGSFYESQGFYSQAEPWLEQGVKVAKTLGSQHPDFATHLNNLANLYESQGRYSEAEPLYLEAVAIHRQALSPNHPSLAIDLNNLANLYESQGRYSEAEPLYLEAVAIHRQALSPNHPSLATHLNNLANLYKSQGRYSEAEPLYLEAVDIHRQALSPNHPSLATHLNNLANLYKSQGRYSEAEPLYLEAVDIHRQALSPNHPSLAIDLNNLAGLYESQGRYSEAEPLYLEAIAILQNSLGSQHPNTITGRKNLLYFWIEGIEAGIFDIAVLQENLLFRELLAEALESDESIQP
ncbi:tetratricopeptide repeat protein [Planktothrix pseudagardhii]|uniref:Kinesin light chain n=1 Tax=Planktothrix pseudagardhii TaxID=132604 RepID=A0A9W4CZJ2_9CYAN|nr:tetratricopeptide repeat protein [Planktothrix pseudagardhii]CAD5986545.1 Kinesin light chain [Planktothrix pseudagardhii]